MSTCLWWGASHVRDLTTMLWKEWAEFVGNQRSVRVFVLAVLLMGTLPVLITRHKQLPGTFGQLFDLMYVLFASVIVVAQTAPDLVLRERSGKTLEYLLSTRLKDPAIFGGKIILAAAVGYLSGLAGMVVQLVLTNLLAGHGTWTWIYLATPQGRLLGFLVVPVIAAYLASMGTFVALRIGEQRTAYMVTILSMGVIAVPFLLRIVHLHATMGWLWQALGVLALGVAIVVALGFRLFRREMLVLYLQD